MKMMVAALVLSLLCGSAFGQSADLFPRTAPLPEQGAGVSAVVKTISRGLVQRNPYAIVGDYLYLAMTGPTLDIYDLVSMERVGSTPLKSAPSWLIPDDASIWDNYSYARPGRVIELDGFVNPAFDPFDVDTYAAKAQLRSLGVSGFFYTAVYRDRVFANPSNGVVKIWSGREARKYTYDTGLAPDACRIAFAGDAPIVFSNTAVFAVDGNMCPIRRIMQIDEGEWPIAAVAGDGKTIAVATGKTLGVWSANGSKLLRQTAIRSIGYPDVWYRCLVPFAGGYLFAGRELVWIHPDASKPVWLATPEGTKPPTAFVPYVPTVELTHRRILMMTAVGDIHVVDPSKVLGRAIAAPAAEGGPRPVAGILQPAAR